MAKNDKETQKAVMDMLTQKQAPINPSKSGYFGGKGKTSTLDDQTRPIGGNKILY